MFGLFDLFTKRVNDQIAEYAAAHSEIVRRLWGGWLDPFHACRPVTIRTDRDARNGVRARDPAGHRSA